MPPESERIINKDLFGPAPAKRGRATATDTPAPDAYSAKDIEVLEGLEPVRRRPGMYIGGVDDDAASSAAEIRPLVLHGGPRSGAVIVRF